MSQVIATGGTVTDIVDGGVRYRVHTFTTSGDLVVTQGGEVEYLVVSGGGGGGSRVRGAGGGGAGGLLTGSASVTTGSLSVVVGAGGPGGIETGAAAAPGTDGTGSSFLSFNATGGGGGGATSALADLRAGRNGGSGGGGGGGTSAGQNGPGGTGISGQGFAGGTGFGSGTATLIAGGGGGGASAVGGNASSGSRASGGAGLVSAFDGTSREYAKGGDGGDATTGAGAAGTLGGGGNGAGGATAVPGGNGGSGIVIIRYVAPFPEPTVTIGGVDYTGDTIDAVRITRGRDTVYADTQPSYATIRLIDKTGTGIPITVGDPVQVDLAPSRTVFYGTITDWTAELYDAGLRNTPAATVTVTAVGPLSRLGRRFVLTAGRASELDAERIDAALDEAFTGVDPGLINPYDPALIDPGVFDLAALPAQAEGYNGLALVNQAATSGAGIIWETGDGYIAFADADRRPANRTAGGYTIPPDVVTAQLQTYSQLGDITNRVVLTYSGGTVDESDQDSIDRFGLWESEINTVLENQSNAETRAAEFLQTHAVPTVQTGRIIIRVDGLDPDLADDLLDLNINDYVILPIPNTLNPTNREGFIEQIVTRTDAFRAEVTLTVSDFRLSVGAQRWAQVDPTIAWEDVDATLTWADAIEVTT